MHFTEKAMMHIDAGVPVSVGFILTHWTAEQFAPLHLDAPSIPKGEPLPWGSAAGTILTGAMRVHFCGDCPDRIGFLTRVVGDLAAKLVGLPAVHAP